MMGNSIADRLADEIKSLAPELQQRVLEFAQSLAISKPRGLPGRQLLQFAGDLTLEDAQLMRDAIENGCEKIDSHEW
jgi:hypothetical protein